MKQLHSCMVSSTGCLKIDATHLSMGCIYFEITIYYWNKCNGDYLEHVHFPRQGIFFLVSGFSNKSLSYKWAASIWRLFWMILSPNKKWRKIFSSLDQGLIVVIVYYFKIWSQKKSY